MKRTGVRTVAMILGLMLIFSVTAVLAAADNSVGLELVADKADYVVGETASVTVKLTGIGDELADGMALGALETHIRFDTAKLSFQSGAFLDPIKGSASQDGTEKVQPTTQVDGVVLLAYEKNGGVTLSADESGAVAVAEVKFEVLSPALGGEIAFWFDTAYDNVVMKAVGSLKEKLLTVTVAQNAQESAAKASVVAGSLANGTAQRTDASTVTGAVEVRSSSAAVLIAAAYDAQQRQIGSPVTRTVTGVETVSGITFDNVTASEVATVKYMLWDGLDGMKGLVSPLTVTVTAP